MVVAEIMAPKVNKGKRVASSSRRGQKRSQIGQSSESTPTSLSTLQISYCRFGVDGSEKGCPVVQRQ